MVVACRKNLLFQIISLPTSDNFDIVEVCKCSLVTNGVLLVDSEETLRRNTYSTTHRGRTIEWVTQTIAVATQILWCDIRANVQSLNWGDGCVQRTCEVIRNFFVGVNKQVNRIIALWRTTRTYCIGVGTRVIYLITITIYFDALIGITYIERIDRSHGISCIEYVAS